MNILCLKPPQSYIVKSDCGTNNELKTDICPTKWFDLELSFSQVFGVEVARVGTTLLSVGSQLSLTMASADVKGSSNQDWQGFTLKAF